MSTITITQNGVSETRDIERTYSGTNTMTIRNTPSVRTAQVELTVDGHSNLDGLYIFDGSNEWEQDGADGRIGTQGWNSESNYQMWFVYDDDDYDPYGETDNGYNWFTFKDNGDPWSTLDDPSHKVQVKNAVEYLALNR